MESSWFRKGLDSRQVSTEVGDKGMSPVDTNVVSGTSVSINPTETKLDLTKPNNLNAFDLISLSTGFDLSGLFVTNDQKEEVQFTWKNTSSAIISKFVDIAMYLKFKVKENQGFMRLEGCNAGRSGILSIDVEIFEISSSFHLVEVKKCGGDTTEYQKMLKRDLRPALKEIVWAWQGEQQHH
ncbi:CBL-interacting serine/threonine-protein kinase 10 [Abeliophyllum distichum]|uniref:non-specific serine/threonine protein kinase n=1 Tax=Abeliophyllum distichum TaxID=126358 RepID=A0ABD1VRI9_9LAMI